MAARRATQTGSDATQPRRDSAYHQPIYSLDDCKKKELPANFAETVLDLEILLDNDFIEIEKVKELLELYMIGVEHYESVGDQRYIYFNKKMSSLMMKPNVIDAMSRDKEVKNGESSPDKLAKSKEEALRDAEIRQKEEQIRKTVNYSHQDNDEKAKAIMKNVQQEIKQNQKIIHDQIDSQRRAVFERLNNRRSKTLTKASSVPVLTDNVSSDNDDLSSQEGSTVITSRVDFSSITNAIREDDQEDDNEEDLQRKNKTRSLSTLDRIRRFKEEMLNGKVSSPRNESCETRSNRNSLTTSNKVRSNSQSYKMQKRNSAYTKQIRDKKASVVKQKRRIKSKTLEQILPVEENEVLLTVQELKEMQQQIVQYTNNMVSKYIEPFSMNLAFKQIIQEKQEEYEETSSPIRQLKRNN